MNRLKDRIKAKRKHNIEILCFNTITPCFRVGSRPSHHWFGGEVCARAVMVSVVTEWWFGPLVLPAAGCAPHCEIGCRVFQ
jgi:hypothetical protein